MRPGLPLGAETSLPHLALSIVAGLVAAALLVVQAWLLSRVIDAGFLLRTPLASLAPLLATLAAIAVARAGASWMSDLGAHAAAARAKHSLRSALLDRVVAVGPRGLSTEESGELAHTIGAGLDGYDAYIGQYLPQAALALFAPILVLIAVAWIDPLSGLVLLLTWPLIPLFMFLIGGAARDRTARQWQHLSRMSARFLDSVQGLPTLKAFNRSRDAVASIAHASERFRTLTMGVLKVAFVSSLTLELLATLSVAVIAVEIGLRLLYDRVAFQPALFVLILAPEFYGPLRRFGAAFHAGMAGREIEKRASVLLQQPVEPTAAADAGAQVVAVRPEQPPAIDIAHVSFAYSAGAAPALDDVTLRLEPGRVTALAGPSGAGKSTLAQILLGFIAPASGRVLVDGVPLSSLDRDAWRAAIAWVPQRPHLFHGTVLENVRLGAPSATREDVQRALEDADAAGFVADLPRGLDTVIGEHGEGLSGGQAQRLALARAFLRNAPVVILDEPTAQLDPESADRISNAIARLAAGRTTLVIAHRRSTIAGADRAALLVAGRIVRAGDPTDVLSALSTAPGGRAS